MCVLEISRIIVTFRMDPLITGSPGRRRRAIVTNLPLRASESSRSGKLLLEVVLDHGCGRKHPVTIYLRSATNRIRHDLWWIHLVAPDWRAANQIFRTSRQLLQVSLGLLETWRL
jgi:hypothetical protein